MIDTSDRSRTVAIASRSTAKLAQSSGRTHSCNYDMLFLQYFHYSCYIATHILSGVHLYMYNIQHTTQTYTLPLIIDIQDYVTTDRANSPPLASSMSSILTKPPNHLFYLLAIHLTLVQSSCRNSIIPPVEDCTPGCQLESHDIICVCKVW